MAQFGSALDLGSRGRGFKSRIPDQHLYYKVWELSDRRCHKPMGRKPLFRDMAQMVARFLGVEEATGSSPVISTRSNSGALRRPGYYKSNRHTQQIYSIKNIIGSSPIPALIIG